MKGRSYTAAPLFFGAALCAELLYPSDAGAHLVTTGMGPVYDGIGHLLLTPEDLIPALAVALYAGLRGKDPGRQALFLFPLAWLIGGFAGFLVTSAPVFPVHILSFLVLGGLIASDLGLPGTIITAMVITVGSIHGFYNGIAMQGGPGIPGLFGISSILFVLVAIAAALVISIKAAWTRVVVRVAGSWIVAVGLLMLGWMAKGTS